jgi:hypothetical protein
MLLTPTRFRRTAVIWAAALVQLWPTFVLAQAQVEAVPVPPPAFEMWNVNTFEERAIALPGEPDTPVAPVGLPTLSDADAAPPAWDTSSDPDDPCRHFTPEERRLLPTLCGAAD